MEDYRLEQSGQEVQDILNGAAMQSDLTAETERATEAEQTLQGNIDIEERDRKAADLTLQGNIDAEELRAKAAEKQNADDIDALEEKVPSGASASNKLATESYVDDSVATATATFRGTYNLVSDLHLTVSATEQQIATALALAISTADNNDYCFVQVPTSSETPTEIKEIDRYKFNGTAWSFEYKLNNSGFTTAQWAAINSGITSGDVTKLAALPTNTQLTTLLAGKQDVLTFDNVPTEGSSHPVKSGGVYSAIDDEKTARENADSSLSSAIEAILLLIPSAATSLNKLADKAFVNSSIATASATFRGTYNLVTDLSLTVSATHAQIATALAGAVSDEDNNDYAFVQIPTSDATPTQIAKTERYKFNGTAWEYEYDLNNSGYTAAQWAAINSGITSALVTKLSALPTNAELTSALGVLTSSITTINQKIPSAASQANKLVDTAAMESYIVQVLDVLTASFNVTSTDGHVTVSISQVDGKITSVSVSTSDIASAASLSLIAGRVTTAEGNISTNAADIANLQYAYAALTQSDIIVGTLPATGVTNTVYRVPGTSTYADWMYYDGAWVKLAEYTTLDGYLYKGIATPSSSPAASADKMFYFAVTPGTYVNFGNLVVTQGVCVLKYDGANWTKDQVLEKIPIPRAVYIHSDAHGELTITNNGNGTITINVSAEIYIMDETGKDNTVSSRNTTLSIHQPWRYNYLCYNPINDAFELVNNYNLLPNNAVIIDIFYAWSGTNIKAVWYSGCIRHIDFPSSYCDSYSSFANFKEIKDINERLTSLEGFPKNISRAVRVFSDAGGDISVINNNDGTITVNVSAAVYLWADNGNSTIEIASSNTVLSIYQPWVTNFLYYNQTTKAFELVNSYNLIPGNSIIIDIFYTWSNSDLRAFWYSECIKHVNYSSYYKNSCSSFANYNELAKRTFPYSIKIFRRVGCIGDSYTSGYIHPSGGSVVEDENYAWPHFMESITKNVYSNWGWQGSTAKSWMSGAAKLSEVQAPGNKCQAYVIGLMINDRDNSQWNPYYTPVGNVSDIGTDADTYYAWYYKLVQAVIAVNSSAPIFCNTCPQYSKNDAYNQAVRDIVSYCRNNNQKVYLNDLTREEYEFMFNNPVFVDDAVNGHYTAIGYEYMAECLKEIISDTINSYVDEFQNVHLIPFDNPS